MTKIKITNADAAPVSRYGFHLKPGEVAMVESEIILAYSAMEISLASQVVAKRVSRVAYLIESELDREARARRENRIVIQRWVQVKTGFGASLRRLLRRPPALREEITSGW